LHTANREKPLSHHICHFKSGLCAYLASSASIEGIFTTYGLVCSKNKNSLDAETAEKLVELYPFYRAEKPLEFT